jgi:hypothetical protein
LVWPENTVGMKEERVTGNEGCISKVFGKLYWPWDYCISNSRIVNRCESGMMGKVVFE